VRHSGRWIDVDLVWWLPSVWCFVTKKKPNLHFYTQPKRWRGIVVGVIVGLIAFVLLAAMGFLLNLFLGSA